jgi:hypothetical protein
MTDDERRLPDLLAGSPDSSTDALLLAHGFTAEMVVGLARAGLATTKAEQTFAAGRAVDVTRVRITDAGRRALGGALMPDVPFILRRANASRKGGHWQHEDYDVFDGDHDVGRIYGGDGPETENGFPLAPPPCGGVRYDDGHIHRISTSARQLQIESPW